MSSKNPNLVTISELANALQSSSTVNTKLELDLNYCTEHDITVKPVDLPFYVEPDLKEAHQAKEEEVFYLISAPAAVGKTSLSRELHRRLHSNDRPVIYVPLQGAIIGQHFFAGLISGLFPEASKTEILDTLFSGNLLIIFDGYDEISMSAVQIELNKLFTTELADAYQKYKLKGRRGVPSIIFLYRSVFSYYGVFAPILNNARQLSVEFFSEPKRRQYLSRYMSKSKNTEKTNNKLIEMFLDALENHLSVASAEAAAFFGHAIVLSAFGDFLLNQTEENTIKLANELTTTGPSEQISLNILTKIITTILDREVKKFPNNVFDKQMPEFNGYPVELQEDLLAEIANLLAEEKEANIEIESLVDRLTEQMLLSNAQYNTLQSDEQNVIRSRYREEVKEKLGHHPFLDLNANKKWVFRNPIYYEFYLAKAISRDLKRSPAPILDKSHSISFYMAMFILAKLPNRSLTGTSPDLVYYLANLLSTASAESELGVYIEWISSENVWRIFFESENVAVDPVVHTEELFIIQVPNGGLLQNLQVLSTFSSHSSANSNQIFSIAGSAGFDELSSRFVLRNSHISAGDIELDAARITFDNAFLDCQRLSFTSRVGRLDGLDSLAICGEHEVHINASDFVLNAWGKTLEAKKRKSGNDVDGFREKLERVFLYFRKHKRADYAVGREKFDTYVIRKGREPEMELLSEFLFQKNILSKQEGLVFLNQEKLAPYGVFYVQQNRLSVNKELVVPLFEDWQQFRAR